MVHGVSVTDKIWLTCSALHNFLTNGDEPWDKHMNVTSDYATNINMVIPCTTNANGIVRPFQPGYENENETQVSFS